MSITVQHTIWCDRDNCSIWHMGCGSTKAVLAEAKTMGWRRVKQDGETKDLCPAHAQNKAANT